MKKDKSPAGVLPARLIVLLYGAGSVLLSHLRSTIGAGELNFFVRNGER